MSKIKVNFEIVSLYDSNSDELISFGLTFDEMEIDVDTHLESSVSLSKSELEELINHLTKIIK